MNEHFSVFEEDVLRLYELVLLVFRRAVNPLFDSQVGVLQGTQGLWSLFFLFISTNASA